MLRGEVDAQIGCAQAEQHKVHCEMEGAKPAHRDKKMSNEDKGLQRPDARFICPFGALFFVPSDL